MVPVFAIKTIFSVHVRTVGLLGLGGPWRWRIPVVIVGDVVEELSFGEGERRDRLATGQGYVSLEAFVDSRRRHVHRGLILVLVPIAVMVGRRFCGFAFFAFRGLGVRFLTLCGRGGLVTGTPRRPFAGCTFRSHCTRHWQFCDFKAEG